MENINKSQTAEALSSGTTIGLTDEASTQLIEEINPIIGYVDSKYEEAERAKRPFEEIAMRAYRNYRGIYGPDVQFLDTEKSRAFIKITKTKVLASYGQILDVLFSQNQLPLDIVASKEPLGAPEVAHIDPNDPIDKGPEQPPMDILGYEGDGNPLSPGETIGDRLKKWASGLFGGLPIKLKPGAGANPQAITLTPADDIAKVMNKRIHDQLEEGDAGFEIRKAAFEKVLLGTGILYGPFNKDKEYPDWSDAGEYTPTKTEIPVIEHLSWWEFYPDPEATKVPECDYIIRTRKMSATELRALKRNKSFISKNIDLLLMNKPNYERRHWEQVVRESAQQVDTNSRYFIKEYWGIIDRTTLVGQDLKLGFTLPDDVDELACNIWVSGNHILRFVVNPFTPRRMPFLACPYELNPYSIFGIGLPENMEDTQMLMNGFIRMAVDNGVLSGSVMLEVDETMLTTGQDYKVQSGKIFRKTAGPPGVQAIRSIQIANTSGANLQMFDTARRLADEATGIPSFSHGMTGVQGVGRTAGGISMLMGASSLTTKTIVKNIDDHWLRPLGLAYYHWNMQFKFDPKLRGDLSVVARGMSNLMQKEQKAQKLTQFAQAVLPNPYAAMWVKWPMWVKEFGTALDIQTERLLNNPDQAVLQARLMQALQSGPPQQQGAAPGPQPGQGPPARPGEQGFSASSGADVMAERGAQNEVSGGALQAGQGRTPTPTGS